MISKILMNLAAFVMLLMSAVPHHHHCTEAGTASHIDYICFAADDFDNADDCTEDDNHGHHSDECLLHSIVTLLTRVQNVPSFQPAIDAIIQAALTLPNQEGSLETEFSVLLSERLAYFHIVRSLGLRAPPMRLA